MAKVSAYIHSDINKAGDLSVSTSVIDSIKGVDGNENSLYVKDTEKKLESIRDMLKEAENNFLGSGYTPERAQDIANNTPNLLVQMANDVLNGTDAYEMAITLMQNKKINNKKLINILQSNVHNKFEQELVNKITTALKNNMGTGELATILAKTFANGAAEIEVTEAGSHIKALGGLLNVNKIEATFRKDSPTIDIANDIIFKTSNKLVTKNTGVYRNMIRELFEASDAVTRQSYGSAINNFCIKLGKKMKSLVEKYIPFIIGPNKDEINEKIDEFIEKLKPALYDALQKKANKEMFYRSNVIGMTGEEVRTTVSQVGGSTIVSFLMGDETEKEGVNKINSILRDKEVNKTISEMKTYHNEYSQSLTDLVLLNTRTNEIARAQSKNHFIAYLTREDESNSSSSNDSIKNFRWMVVNDLNLFYFLSNLSSSNLGITLSNFNLSTIMDAMANNLWFQYHDSAFPKDGRIGFANATVEDFQKELEGSLEKLLSGQIVDLLGVTVVPDNKTVRVLTDRSNIFYLLNGRLKRTSDLIQQAIDQLTNSENLKMSKTERMVIVNLKENKTKSIGVGEKSDSFLVQKLRNAENKSTVEKIGEDKGEDVLNAIKIGVSLGTDINKLKRSSLTTLL